MNLTDNEIIKALECCSIRDTNCIGCPYCEKTYCVDADALDLINRQKAQIESLNIAVDVCKQEYNDMFEIAQKQKAEIERLRKECISLKDQRNAYKDIVDTCEAGAIKEFAERLKEELRLYTENNGGFVPSMIDNLVKEMVGQE